MSMSTLPPTVEGMNGVNFMTSLGVPFIKTRRDPYGQENLNLSGKLFQTLGKTSDWLDDMDSNSLAQYFVEARSPDSKLKLIFEESSESNQKNNEKLKSSIDESLSWVCNEGLHQSEVQEPGKISLTLSLLETIKRVFMQIRIE